MLNKRRVTRDLVHCDSDYEVINYGSFNYNRFGVSDICESAIRLRSSRGRSNSLRASGHSL